jgi:hypothetical protein
MRCVTIVLLDYRRMLARHAPSSWRDERFAAPMPLPGNQSEIDHVKADLIVTLTRYCQEAKDTVVTFRRGADRVSPLRGAAEE